MSKVGFLFPGQGGQRPGMGKELLSVSAAARAVWQTGSEVLGIDLAKLIGESTQEEIDQTQNAQLAIFTNSMAAVKALEDKGIVPDGVAGFSLGECAALCTAGVFSLEDGFRLVQKRGELMNRAAEETGGCMYAVIGLEDAQVEEICGKIEGYVVPVNYNCPGQLVIAGETAAAEKAAAACLEAGAGKAIRLATSGAFHTRMMEGAAIKLKAYVSTLVLHAPQIAVYCNADGKPIPEDKDLPDHMESHMIRPVRWKEAMQAMQADGYTQLIETGEGKTLAGFMRRISRDVKVQSYTSL